MSRIVVLSAGTGVALAVTRQRLASALADPLALDDVATTLAVGREQLPARFACVAASLAEVRAALRGDRPAYEGRGDRPPHLVAVGEEPALLSRLARYGVQVDTVYRESGHDQDGVHLDTAYQDLPAGRVLTLGLGGPDGDLTLSVDASEDDLQAVVAALWCRGVEADLVAGAAGRRIRLPGYAFHRGPRRSTGEGLNARPLTALQQRLFFLDLVRTGSNAEHAVVAATRLTGPVDAGALRRAFTETQREYETLRTVFKRIGSRWMVVVLPEADAAFSVREAPDPDAALDAALDEFTGLGFELEDTPMVRARLITAPDGTHLLAVAAHRAVADELTLRSLLADVAAACPDAVRTDIHGQEAA